MTEQVKQDLEETIRILDERGWCQHVLQNSVGQVCLEGALALAVCDNVHGIVHARLNEALRQVNQILAAEFGTDMAHVYNDRPSTSAEDVKLLLKRAIEESAK